MSLPEKIYTPIRIKEEKNQLLLRSLFPGIGILVVAIGYYYLAGSIDDGSGPSRVNWLVYIVYESLGQIYGTILFLIISILLFTRFIYKWILLQKNIKSQQLTPNN